MRKIAILSIFILSLFAVNMAFSAEQPEMSVYVADINASETAYVQVTLPSDAQGKVNVSVNGQTFSAIVVDGKATVNLTDLKSGDYVVNVTYEGSGNYSKISKEVNLKVNGESNTTNQNATSVGNASGGPAATQNATSAGNASGGPLATLNVTKVTANNQTNTSNTTNNTNATPAKKVINNTNKTVKNPKNQQPKKQQPKLVESLTNKNTGLPVLVLLLVAIGAVFAVAFRKQ